MDQYLALISFTASLKSNPTHSLLTFYAFHPYFPTIFQLLIQNPVYRVVCNLFVYVTFSTDR